MNRTQPPSAANTEATSSAELVSVPVEARVLVPLTVFEAPPTLSEAWGDWFAVAPVPVLPPAVPEVPASVLPVPESLSVSAVIRGDSFVEIPDRQRFSSLSLYHVDLAETGVHEELNWISCSL